MHSFFNDKDFIKVNTPILQSGAGGAVARPFETEATELQGETLNLRIAPELWLKRLMVGGMDRVYELGPVFRNEGVDATHNPEFTICEFYAAKASLDNLMQWTEALFRHIQSEVSAAQAQLSALELPDLALSSPFQVLEFIPDLEKAMNRSLPDLSSSTAQPDVINLFAELDLDLPSKPTLPRLLDALAAAYLEPLCMTPTFITNHPACLSPLSKHHTCPQTSQRISARAELFVAGRELANMYEEENSPFAQRAKFEQQLLFQAEDGEGDGRKSVDESYLAALEWGLPPTGGWGCGVDRLVMLFSGRPRLGDVLAFGGLRNVVGLGGGRK
jgi:lysyl-tRNA synthetase class 2